MKTEQLIEQIAEIRALQVLNTFMLQQLLEMVGCDPDALIDVVDKMNCSLADRFENQMRKGCDMQPRAEARREPVMPKIRDLDFMRNIDWSQMKEQ